MYFLIHHSVWINEERMAIHCLESGCIGFQSGYWIHTLLPEAVLGNTAQGTVFLDTLPRANIRHTSSYGKHWQRSSNDDTCALSCWSIHFVRQTVTYENTDKSLLYLVRLYLVRIISRHSGRLPGFGFPIWQKVLQMLLMWLEIIWALQEPLEPYSLRHCNECHFLNIFKRWQI